MRSDKELRHALLVLGSSFVLDGGMRRFIWENYPHELESAKGMFQALCWMVGTDKSGLETTLEYVQLKAAEYVRLQQQQKENTTHA